MKAIKQSVVFKASPKDVYGALIDSKKHSKFTGDKAVISKKVGGKFTAFSGYAFGKNLKLVPGKKIVQSWSTTEWPNGAYSKATFDLKKTKTGTKLTFTQTGVPDKFYKDIKQGWITYYWKPMKKFLEK